MKKTTEEVVEETTPEVTKPDLLATEFGREDLNAMRDAVNYLLSKE